MRKALVFLIMAYCFIVAMLPLAEADLGPRKSVMEAENSNEADNVKIYTVRRGDTLSGISLKHKTTISAIMAWNPEIKNSDLIFVGQNIRIEIEKKTKKAATNVLPQPSEDEKISILKKVGLRKGIPWEILAGLAKQESQLGKFLSGDGGRSVGPFHIYLPAHPEVAIEQAMDWEWSANWAADYLIELGAKENMFKALRLWNGSIKNPKTHNHAEKVFHYAKNVFGLKTEKS